VWVSVGIAKRVELLPVDILGSRFFSEFGKCSLFQCLFSQDEATRQGIEPFAWSNASFDQKKLQRLLVNREDDDATVTWIVCCFMR
jgi:hypothetical protein